VSEAATGWLLRQLDKLDDSGREAILGILVLSILQRRREREGPVGEGSQRIRWIVQGYQVLDEDDRALLGNLIEASVELTAERQRKNASRAALRLVD
jgi:hypothetical protein